MKKAHEKKKKYIFKFQKHDFFTGNGPAGLSLSVFLSGWQPYYDINSPHPDSRLHARLSQNAKQSLLDQDLSWFEEEFAEIINPSVRPIAFLIDMLMRPPNGKSCLRYVQNPTKSVSHIVLGETDAGGSWNSYDEEMITVSLLGWLDLPAFSLVEWFQGQPLIARLPAGVIREYMKAYAKEMGITENLRPYTRVTEVSKKCDNQGKDYYDVKGEDKNGQLFKIRCRKVVLACGQNYQKLLGVSGEEESTKDIVYDIAAMKKSLLQKDNNNIKQNLPVVVIGDGISAADAIIQCLKSKHNVIHVMRRSDAQLRTTMLSKLSATIYPEYAQAYKLMTGKEKNPLYERIIQGTAREVLDSVVSLNTPNGIIQQPYSLIVACLGRRAELSMLSEEVEFLADYRCASDKKMFAIGSLAGDHFIRYLIGGSLQVASTLFNENKQEEVEELQRQLLAEHEKVEKRQKCIRRKHASSRICWLSRILSTSS
uniref:L-ornithine N(5)-monooxygenase n=1 Tax=Panagrolaimus superbus TaxID=310955 RepID=A0A914Z7Y7_9BILA